MAAPPVYRGMGNPSLFAPAGCHDSTFAVCLSRNLFQDLMAIAALNRGLVPTAALDWSRNRVSVVRSVWAGCP
ncbi:hypothetical protein CPA40_01755 [Bifidobacterium callitrichos]|uniref:Uncharacterized protein n=1 Tax=Bifidobacterium callitrichos TaxID=762209 RepID=A0A2T3GC57_9BIFI|nr:hypothetical protein CPA40_01755 [Bifidobacterium callitrichos]